MNTPQTTTLIFIDGPMDGDVATYAAPPEVFMKRMNVEGYPQGFYYMESDGKYHWRDNLQDAQPNQPLVDLLAPREDAQPNQPHMIPTTKSVKFILWFNICTSILLVLGYNRIDGEYSSFKR